jgi:predicted alpha/beta hydrolase
MRDPSSALLVFLPAMGVPASFYGPFAERLRSRGLDVLLADLPGQGKHPLRARQGDDYGYREVVEDLIPELLRRAAMQHPGKPLLLGGHSLGGQLALLASHGVADKLQGLVLVAAGTAHWRAWPRGKRLRAALTVHAISAVARVLPWYPGQRLGFGGDQSRRFMRDWSRNACKGIYAPEGGLLTAGQLRQRLARVALPSLSVRIGGDPVAPAGAADALCALLPEAAHSTATVPGVASDGPWRRHFSWARQPGGVEEALHEWLGDERIRIPQSHNAFEPIDPFEPLDASALNRAPAAALNAARATARADRSLA